MLWNFIRIEFGYKFFLHLNFRIARETNIFQRNNLNTLSFSNCAMILGIITDPTLFTFF